MTPIEAIREALAAATPGPWVDGGTGGVHVVGTEFPCGPAVLVAHSKSGYYTNWQANVAYAVACNPSAIAALLTAHDAALARAEAAEARIAEALRIAEADGCAAAIRSLVRRDGGEKA